MSQIASLPAQSDQLTQQILFPLLAKRGIAEAWANAPDVRSDVSTECRQLAGDAAFMASLKTHLDSNPIIRASCESMSGGRREVAGHCYCGTPPFAARLAPRPLVADFPLDQRTAG